MKFRKKPVVIEATQWFKNGDHPLDYSRTHDGFENDELRQFSPAERKAKDWEGDIVRYYRTPSLDGQSKCKHCGDIMHNHGWIDTLEGGHIVCPGDFVITGVKGEHYPCKPDIFAATYEPVQQMNELLNFGDALKALKSGKKLQRHGWNGKGMFVQLIPGADQAAEFNAPPAWFNPYFTIKNTNGSLSTWVPSINDVLSEDWQVVE